MAGAHTQVLQNAQGPTSMTDQGEVGQNRYAERLIRTVKEEEVDLSEYLVYHDAYRQLGRFLDTVSMRQRILSSLEYLTTAEFEAQWLQEHTLVLDLEQQAA